MTECTNKPFSQIYIRSLPMTLVINQSVAVLITFILSFYSGMKFLTTVFFICLLFSNCIGLSILFFFCLFDAFILTRFRENKPVLILLYFTFHILGMILGTEAALALEKILIGVLDFPFLSQKHLTLLATNFFISAIFAILVDAYLRQKTKLKQKIIENEKIKQLQTQTELMALQSKMNPHFLFNTLNTIVDLVYKEPRKVEHIILNLSDIYRKMLSFPETDLIPIEEEMELVRAYLDIEKIRMGPRLTTSISMDDSLRQFRIPPLIIEPLVENAVIHGISPKKEGGRVSIRVTREEGRIRISIADNGLGLRTKMFKPGFGLYSVQERLKMIYKDKARFNIERGSEGGTEVSMELPHEY